jgi:acetyl-CoA synthetase
MADDKTTAQIDALLREDREFAPSPEFVAHAHVSDPDIYERADKDPEAFWARVRLGARVEHALDEGPRLEAAARRVVRRRASSTRVVNCLDRHVRTGAGTRRPSSGKASPATSAR